MAGSKINLIIGGLVILLVVVGVAYFLMGPKEDTSTGISVATSTATQTNVNDNFLALLLKFQNVKISTKIFDDPVFRSLVDKSVPLNPELVGRPNPFLPLDAGVRSATGTPVFIGGSSR